ncbi:tryptophanase leader peptide [Enterovibrio sp. NIFS-20-8]|nr:tryptophanase leader peptide [Enterovibrio paralichthyis]
MTNKTKINHWITLDYKIAFFFPA